ncbi:MAG TPA: transposase [Anaerolineaceae bacterium]
MSLPEVYQEIQIYLADQLRDPQGQPVLGKRTLERLTVLVAGILKAKQVAPARIALAGAQLSERGTSAESVERRVRRIENDPRVQTSTCLDPLVQALLAGHALAELLLIVDPTLQQDRVVMVNLNAWYRGRSLPLAWTLWPANQPLTGAGFWQRMAVLLDQAARLLPAGMRVTVLADRAFGTPAFTDLVAGHGWHWIVRVQGQTHCQDVCGREQAIAHLLSGPGERRKLHGRAFKKAGWREASVVVYWRPRFPAPLCLVTDLPPEWRVVGLYRRRFPIEPTFRDYKSYGWHWEQGQVSDLQHLQRLLIGMALATWLTMVVGACRAADLFRQPPSRKRHTRPWWGKMSLFRIGLEVWASCFDEGLPPWLWAGLPEWDAPNWSTQICAYHAKAFIFA